MSLMPPPVKPSNTFPSPVSSVAPSTPTPSTPAPATQAPAFKPHYFVQPKASILDRINIRALIVAGLVLLFVGAPFYTWLRESINGGISWHGNYADVDLKAMSSFDLDQMNGQYTDVPAKWRALEGKRVNAIGQMWAQQEAGDGNLSYFQLVYSRTKCCFSGPPLAQHFVDCNVKQGVSAQYYPDMVRVWGIIHVRLRREPGGVIKSVYGIDVDHMDPM